MNNDSKMTSFLTNSASFISEESRNVSEKKHLSVNENEINFKPQIKHINIINKFTLDEIETHSIDFNRPEDPNECSDNTFGNLNISLNSWGESQSESFINFPNEREEEPDQLKTLFTKLMTS